MNEELTFGQFESQYRDLTIKYSYAMGCKYNSALEDLYDCYLEDKENFTHETIKEMIKSLYED